MVVWTWNLHFKFSATENKAACFVSHLEDFPNGGKHCWASESSCESTLPLHSNIIGSPSSPREPTRTLVFFFPSPFFALHCLVTNPCLSFHLITFIQAKSPMEGPQSANPFVLRAFQFLTFTAPAPFTCFVLGNNSLLFACQKRFQ